MECPCLFLMAIQHQRKELLTVEREAEDRHDVPAYNTSTQEGEAGEWKIPGQLGLHSKALSQRKKGESGEKRERKRERDRKTKTMIVTFKSFRGGDGSMVKW
jgi:hypothetical protein